VTATELATDCIPYHEQGLVAGFLAVTVVDASEVVDVDVNLFCCMMALLRQY